MIPTVRSGNLWGRPMFSSGHPMADDDDDDDDDIIDGYTRRHCTFSSIYYVLTFAYSLHCSIILKNVLNQLNICIEHNTTLSIICFIKKVFRNPAKIDIDTGTMNINMRQIMPTKLYEAIEQVGINTAKQILVLSVWDIQKLTNLSMKDVKLIKHLIANDAYPASVPVSKLLNDDHAEYRKVTTGCSEINSILEGGYRKGTITEIFGESGTGKTQLGIQAALHNWSNSVIYICTEGPFPTKRFNEIKRSVPNYDSNIDYGKNIFVEHIIEARDLLSCVKVRLPRLLSEHKCSLIIIDSVAAPFRVDNTNYVQRAEELRELSMALIAMGQEHQLAILCINQVTASFDDSANMLPSLGLAWSNMVCTRLWVKKTMNTIDASKLKTFEWCSGEIPVRELIVTFAPDLANTMVKFVITDRGIKGIM